MYCFWTNLQGTSQPECTSRFLTPGEVRSLESGEHELFFEPDLDGSYEIAMSVDTGDFELYLETEDDTLAVLTASNPSGIFALVAGTTYYITVYPNPDFSGGELELFVADP